MENTDGKKDVLDCKNKREVFYSCLLLRFNSRELYADKSPITCGMEQLGQFREMSVRNFSTLRLRTLNQIKILTCTQFEKT